MMHARKNVLIAVAMMTMAGAASAEAPAGADEIHGAFGRMLTHGSTAVMPAHGSPEDASDFQFERWVNTAARGDMSSLELGFANMIARADDVPPALTVDGTPDAVAVMVARALQAQAQASRAERHAAL